MTIVSQQRTVSVVQSTCGRYHWRKSWSLCRSDEAFRTAEECLPYAAMVAESCGAVVDYQDEPGYLESTCPWAF